MNYYCKLILTVPWGSDKESIPAAPVHLAHPIGGSAPTSKRYIRPHYGVRIDNQGHVYILFPVPQNAEPDERKYRLFQFNHEGSLINSFDLAHGLKKIQIWHIYDFSPDNEGGIYVLEFIQTKKGKQLQRLRKFNAKGKEQWERKGEFSVKKVDFNKFSGKFNRICASDKNTLFLPAQYPHRGMAQLNTSNGKTIKVYEWEEYPERVTIGPDNNVYSALFIKDKGNNKIVLLRYNFKTGAREIVESEIQSLQNLAGIDCSGAVYSRIYNGIARISPKGKLQWKQSLYGIVVREEENEIFLCSNVTMENNKLELSIERYNKKGELVQTYRCECEKNQLVKGKDVPRFIHIDNKKRFYFHSGETPHDPGIMAIFAHDGTIEETISLSDKTDDTTLFDNLNNRLLPIESNTVNDTIEVDSSGRVYVPISDPNGFKVVCFEPETMEKCEI
ncbi:MAG: hypothetical protein ACMUJM_16985 [bacterium]